MLEIGDDDLDVVLDIAVEFLEGVDAGEFPVCAHEVVALIGDPGRDRLMVAFAAADERSTKIEVLGPAGGGSVDDPREKFFQRAG